MSGLVLSLTPSTPNGVRTRDPHLGKVMNRLHVMCSTQLTWAFVHWLVRPAPPIPPCCRPVYHGNRMTLIGRLQLDTTAARVPERDVGGGAESGAELPVLSKLAEAGPVLAIERGLPRQELERSVDQHRNLVRSSR
jgi:hypothetical protein